MIGAHSRFETQSRRGTFISIVLAIVMLLVAGGGVWAFVSWKSRMRNEQKELLRLWNEGTYEEAFTVSAGRLQEKPMDYYVLTIHGFAAYQLAVAQITTFDTQTYIDEVIWSLRKALLCKETYYTAWINYVLGKAYYHKGTGYEDLAIKFLEAVSVVSSSAELADSFVARDLPEHLGLAYAAVHDYRASVEAFSLALSLEEASPGADTQSEYSPDLLLLAMARSYIALGEDNSARAYLVRCVDTSRDSTTVITARLLLGDIYRRVGDTAEAEVQYLTILEENGEHAEARFQLGELYEAAGDTTRARAEWRRAARIDPTHSGARSRLNLI
ncbi:MAG: tetratricopeptide repeat protein [Treponema sp.]|jgi:tetratricopeptide (TPR) repeat protein|nr:tetratricopeptide repeat protein [Treponema sp.]